MTDNSLNIRAIQHYMYCPRRFGLLENNCDWAENASVIRANLMHENVHDGSHSFDSDKKIVRSGVAVYSDNPEYDIFGVTDCMEFVKAKDGCRISGFDGLYRIRIIEYKPRKPKDCDFNETDAIQVFAQKLCADCLWNTDSECYIYYSDVRRRIKLPFDNPDVYSLYDNRLKAMLGEMRLIISSGVIPPMNKGQRCTGCSMDTCCFPKSKPYNIKAKISEEVL